MRVSSEMIFSAGLAAIQKQTASLLHTQQQVANGRRILTPADDPVGAARALEVEQAKNGNALYMTNQKSAGERLAFEESTLAAVGELVRNVRTLAVQGGGGALTDADRRGIANELRQRFEALLGLANAKDGDGQYLFSGYSGDTKPFAGSVEGGVTYAGDEGQRRLQVSASRQIAVSDSGNDLFMRIRNGNGSFVTTVNAANTGTGVIDAGAVLDPALATGHNYSIGFAMSGTTLHYTVTDTTTSTVVATAPYQSGSAIAFDGISVVVTGAPAPGDTFGIAPSSSQSLFATIADLIAALEAPAGAGAGNALLANRIGFALTNLDQAEENLLRVRAALGARMNEIDALASASANLELNYQETLSRLRDLDYAEAISRLAQQQGYLEAAQKSFLKVSGLSLFDYV
jgi:flagellar hook-associated protein 3 FlgL